MVGMLQGDREVEHTEVSDHANETAKLALGKK